MIGLKHVSARPRYRGSIPDHDCTDTECTRWHCTVSDVFGLCFWIVRGSGDGSSIVIYNLWLGTIGVRKELVSSVLYLSLLVFHQIELLLFKKRPLTLFNHSLLVFTHIGPMSKSLGRDTKNLLVGLLVKWRDEGEEG